MGIGLQGQSYVEISAVFHKSNASQLESKEYKW